jgi:hypothetical protein
MGHAETAQERLSIPRPIWSVDLPGAADVIMHGAQRKPQVRVGEQAGLLSDLAGGRYFP